MKKNLVRRGVTKKNHRFSSYRVTTCIDEKLIFCYCFMLRLVLSRVPVVVVVVGDVVVEEGFVVVGVASDHVVAVEEVDGVVVVC